MCHYGSEDNKELYSNASFSSVTAATESLELSDNGFKTAQKIVELGYGQCIGGGGGGEGGVPPEHYVCALRCNRARTISNLLPTGLLFDHFH